MRVAVPAAACGQQCRRQQAGLQERSAGCLHTPSTQCFLIVYENTWHYCHEEVEYQP
jgi:hypothetical protein